MVTNGNKVMRKFTKVSKMGSKHRLQTAHLERYLHRKTRFKEIKTSLARGQARSGSVKKALKLLLKNLFQKGLSLTT